MPQAVCAHASDYDDLEAMFLLLVGKICNPNTGTYLKCSSCSTLCTTIHL